MSRLQKNTIDKLETFKDLFDNAHDLIHLLEPDGTIIYVNNAWQRVLGFTESEIERRSIYDFVIDEDRLRFESYRNDVIAGKAVEDQIITGFMTAAGTRVYLEGAVTIKVVNNVCLYTRGIFRDVTTRMKNEAELRRMNAELHEREYNLQQVLHHAPDAIIVIDAQSIVRYWNPKATQIFGYNSSEVVGKSLTEFIIPVQHRAAHTHGMKRYLATGEAHVLNRTVEITAIDKEGREFFVALTISKTLQHGQVSFIAFLRNIDQAKKASLELEEKKTQLEISNTQLERFAHVISHDMKEPIRKIVMFVDRLQHEVYPFSGKAGDYIEKINRAADRLVKMVDGILEYASVKGQILEAENVDLNNVINLIAEDLEIIIREKKATIRYQNLPPLYSNRVLLYQLFYNLIYNALKFSREDVPSVIEITAFTTEAGAVNQTAYQNIVVADNGIGFDNQYATAIFETFSRLHPRGKYDGTGLGLFLCKTIVERHGGSISATAEVNKGATFTITLPQKSSG